tara:strand:- start:111 stop:242 length:132 start_codon:yes stop_codon:yes gene_type:complete
MDHKDFKEFKLNQINIKIEREERSHKKKMDALLKKKKEIENEG